VRREVVFVSQLFGLEGLKQYANIILQGHNLTQQSHAIYYSFDIVANPRKTILLDCFSGERFLGYFIIEVMIRVVEVNSDVK